MACVDLGIGDWLMGVGTLGILGGAATNAMGQQQTGNATQAADAYAAQVAQNNAQIAANNANNAAAAGEQQVGQVNAKTKAEVGAIEAGQAGSGVDVGTGSAVAVQASQKEVGLQDALTIRSNAARQAYGYEAAQNSYAAQAGLDTMAGQNAQIAAGIGEQSAIFGGVGSTASGWANYLTRTGVS